eukprot:Nk52_evm1s1125 gene=Nk52_evmTU1s1125
MAAALVLFATWATMLPPVNAKPSDANSPEEYYYKVEMLTRGGFLACKLYADNKCNKLKFGEANRSFLKEGETYNLVKNGKERRAHISYVQKLSNDRTLMEWYFTDDSHTVFADHFFGDHSKLECQQTSLPIDNKSLDRKTELRVLSPLCTASPIT